MNSGNTRSIPELSVLMVTYNQERFILSAVESILRQTFLDFELIIIDDGSDDNTNKVLDGIADPRISRLHNPINMGVAYCRNKALSMATGVFAAFFDSDDLSHPDRFNVQIRFLRNKPDHSLLGSSVILIDETGMETRRWSLKASWDHLLPMMVFHNCFVTSSVIFRRESSLGFHFPEHLNTGEDYLLWWYLLQRGKGKITSDFSTSYRRHSSSLMSVESTRIGDYDTIVYRRIFEDLGLNPAKEEIQLHLALKGGRPISSLQELTQYKNWLFKIALSLSNSHESNRLAIVHVILNRWIKACSLARKNLGLMIRGLLDMPFYINLIWRILLRQG